MLDLLRVAHCNLLKDMVLLYKYMGEELNIEKREIVLGLTDILGAKANQCKIVLNTGIRSVTLHSFLL